MSTVFRFAKFEKVAVAVFERQQNRGKLLAMSRVAGSDTGKLLAMS